MNQRFNKLSNQIFKAADTFGCKVLHLQEGGSQVRATCEYGGHHFTFIHNEGIANADIILSMSEALTLAKSKGRIGV